MNFIFDHAGPSLWILSFLWTGICGLALLCGHVWKEKTLGIFLEIVVALELLSAVLLFSAALSGRTLHWELGPHVRVGTFHFDMTMAFGAREAVYLVLAHAILWLVVRFARSYVAGEEGFGRFMLLLGFLQLGTVLIATGENLALVIAGWELIGIASCLLIAFFVTNRSASAQSMQAYGSYKLADLGLLLAAALMQVHLHSTSLAIPAEAAAQGTLLWIGLFLIIGTLAKSGQFPFITWMPRAMEGPTPSSAVFYGALSVHLGPLLLLRTTQVWSNFPALKILLIVIGSLSALLTSAIGRTRSNIKGQLAYAVLSQVGIMYVELGLGYRKLVLFHICCHASLRAYQFLLSASVIQRFYEGKALVPQRHGRWVGLAKHLPLERLLRRIYLHAWNGFYWELIIGKILVRPLRILARSAYLIVHPQLVLGKLSEQREARTGVFSESKAAMLLGETDR